MAQYIDGFVLPVPRDRLSEYQRVSEAASKIWMEHGALEYRECAGDDLHIEGVRSFSDLASTKEDETVIFAWVVFESKEVRDIANQKIMSDPRMDTLIDPSNPIHDAARMAYGGFRTIVQASSNDNEE